MVQASIYCPPNLYGSKLCHIQGNHNLEGIAIYAVNSWNDIDFQYSGPSTEETLGTVHCGYDYDASCTLSSLWSDCMNSDDYCTINSDNTVHVPSIVNPAENEYTYNDSVDWSLMNATVELSSAAVLFHSKKDDNLDIMFIGAWVVAFAAGWLLCGVLRWKCKKAVSEQREEHARQQTVQKLASLDPEFIQQILKASGSGQDILNIVDMNVGGGDPGDHNPNDDVLPPGFGDSDSEMVPEPLPSTTPHPIARRVRTTTADRDVTITPPSQDAGNAPPPGRCDYVE